MSEGSVSKAHIQRTGRVLEQAGELQFAGAQHRIGHVVDQPDMDGGAVAAAAQQELFDPAHRAACRTLCTVTIPSRIERLGNFEAWRS